MVLAALGRKQKLNYFLVAIDLILFCKQRRRGGLVVRASNSGARGRGFDPHSGCRVVTLIKIHLPPKKVLVIPRKRWLCPDKTEKLLTGT